MKRELIVAAKIDHPLGSLARNAVAGGDQLTSDSQRQRFSGFQARHDSLWPLIAESLVRCHSDITTVSELAERIHPRICLNMQPDGSDIEINYTVDGDPEFRAYFVTLRNWEIAEVCAAE